MESNGKGVHLWLLLWKATKALEGHAERSIQALGMCYSDFAVLEALLHKGPLPVSALGKKVLLTSGSMTAAVDRLQSRGLVARQDDANDRRARVVHLTETGRKLISELFKDHEKDMEVSISCLTKPETETLARLLRKLGRGAEELLNEQEKTKEVRNR